jgi:hypothetical protein
MSRIALSVAVVLVSLVGAVRPAEAKQTSAAHCNRVLESADDARVSLSQMETTLAELEADAASFSQRILELDVDIRFARVAGNDKAAKKLQIEKKAVEQDLQFVEALRPDIATQVTALRDTVSKADHEYIACIEQTIAG